MTRAAPPGERRSRGLSVEERAADFLEGKGFRILARNHACPAGEVDIVAEQGELVVFVEVRSRSSEGFGSPAETIDHRKRRRVVAAATDWAVKAGVWDSRPLRFDVLAIVQREAELDIEHIEAAFDADGST